MAYDFETKLAGVRHPIWSVESIGITRSDRADLLIPSADELYPTNPDLLVFVPSDNEVYIGRRQLKMILYD